MNLLDNSLAGDLEGEGGHADAGDDRTVPDPRALCEVETGADAILFTCSAFGPCIEAIARANSPPSRC